MTRRLILAALALFAFLALESCGVNRLAGPAGADSRSFGARKFGGVQDGDGTDQTLGGGVTALPDMGDSLRTFRKPSPIGGGTGGDPTGGSGGDEQPIAK